MKPQRQVSQNELESNVTFETIECGPQRRKLFIFDKVIQQDASEWIHRQYRDLPVTMSDSDRADTSYVKHLKHEFSPSHWQPNCPSGFMAQRARELLQEQMVEFGDIYRVYANFNLHGDFQFAHEDGEGWTALYFVNSNWEEDWGGELLIYPNPDSGVAYAIEPRPGRMVIFDGMIRHRGGVPSKLCFDARISLAIKFRPS